MAKASKTETAYELTLKAVKSNELDKLLLGISPYACLPKWSPSPANTDITYIYRRGICEYANRYLDEEFSSLLEEALERLAKNYEGIVPVASIIYMEASDRSKGRSSNLNIDIQKLSKILQASIHRNSQKLLMDDSPLSKGRKYGLLGYLEYLNELVFEHDGPGFL